MTEVVPFLWYTDKAIEAAEFYVSLIPNSRIDNTNAMPSDSPSGPLDPFNHAISLMVACEDQTEIDKLWDALSEGGKIEQCGWLQDRYGLFWQIVPKAFNAMTKDKDPARVKRVTDAMLKMVKLDLATLQKAYDGG